MIFAPRRRLTALKAEVRAEIIERARAVMCTVDTTCQLLNVRHPQPSLASELVECCDESCGVVKFVLCSKSLED